MDRFIEEFACDFETTVYNLKSNMDRFIDKSRFIVT